MKNAKKSGIPKRSEIDAEDTWDLSKLYEDDAAWESDRQLMQHAVKQAEEFAGSLAGSAEKLKELMDFLRDTGRRLERLGHYAFLKYAEDAGNSANQARLGRITQLETRISAALSFVEPEILSIPEKKMEEMLESDVLAEYRIKLRKILRFRPYVLSESEEKLLALQHDSAETPEKAFEALTNVDMQFDAVETPEGPKPLSQSTFSSFLQNSDRAVRRQAYEQFYSAFSQHRNTLASLYIGSVKQDIYYAQVRNYPSARAMALYPDNVSETVYDNLISAVHEYFPVLHEYYSLRRQVLGLDTLRHYDVYVPLVSDITAHTPYEEAVELVVQALAPLGEEYTGILRNGLLKGWVDRYENQGKRSGAFSAGSYDSDPYILMNYKEDVLRDVFTLAHEGGHSMHSWYSAANNPFQHYNYTIFEAEVASTFNEQLLAAHMIEHAENDTMKTYILAKQADDVIATIFRQTMFAEFEHKTHQLAEEGEPLTLDLLRSTYRGLLERYFGPEMKLEEESDLEGLRIPHFYRAFYVYKYATGLSAAIALSERVLNGGKEDLERYISFLKSGGSTFPIDSLRKAGVDMSTPKPIYAAMEVFKKRIEELETLLNNRQYNK